MHKAPCEYIMWYVLPVIRREITRSIMDNFGMNQKETAEKLGVTPAAVCQYLSKKRGKIELLDENILREIDVSAARIVNDSGGAIVTETCRICQLLKSQKIFPLQF